jgi:8-oxo-dGTP pyrophosphatase MutT (NUDIX family)
MTSDFWQQLAEQLRAGTLPGWQAQARFEPELAYGRHAGPAPESAREAAVVILLFPTDDGICVPLTARPSHLTRHAGQVSLPGGMREPNETSDQAALRELEEELGVDAAQVTILGPLTELYLFVTDTRVVPWIAWANERPAFRVDEREVQELFEVPLTFLAGAANYTLVWREHRRLRFRAPAICCGDHIIWGATSMILSELLVLVEENQ